MELLKRGQYEKLANPLELSVNLKDSPLELYEARNAVQIASSIGTEEYGKEIFTKAQASLRMAEGFPKGDRRYRAEVVRTARQAVQFAEDARELAVLREGEARLEAERQEAARREAEARAEAAEEAQRRAEAEAARRAEEEARARAEAARTEAEKRESEAELRAAQEAAGRAQAETVRAQALLARQQAMEEARRANRMAEEAQAEKLALRRKLLQQFSMALVTRDTPRGLVVNMSDVLFDVGKADLKPIAREKLARLSGIVLAYPDLSLHAEGHTDSTGSDELNTKLSQARADSVRGFIISQGVTAQNVTAAGLASSMPVGSNETREGRRQNRRVEIIVSGSVIGSDVGSVGAAGR